MNLIEQVFRYLSEAESYLTDNNIKRDQILYFAPYYFEDELDYEVNSYGNSIRPKTLYEGYKLIYIVY
ncbi:MAG: hypothetical protein RLZZ196_3069 [Bacteroidota bacterium]|jgi:hypothetical protein